MSNLLLRSQALNQIHGTTGSFVLTADGVPATVDLLFTSNQGYNSGTYGLPASMLTVSHTTTGGVGSYIDDTSGNWHLVADNVARISNKGALIEEARTTLVPGSANFSGWNTGSGIAGTGISTDLPAVFPGASVWKGIYAGSGDSNCGATPFSNTIAFSTAYTLSVWYYVLGGTGVSSATFDVEAASAISISANANVSLVNQWQKVAVTATSAASGGQTGFFVFRINGPSGATVYFTAPQLEAGSFATSFIQNSTAGTATRSADVVTLTSVPTFGAAATLFASGVPQSPLANPNNQILADLTNTSANRLDLMRFNSNGVFFSLAVNNASQQQGPTTGAINPGTIMKAAVAAANNDQAGANNGVGGAYGTSLAWPPTANLNTVTVGSFVAGSSSFWDGYITRVAVWPSNRISNAGLQSITT